MALAAQTQTVLMNFFIGLAFGMFPFFLLLKGFLFSFLKARLGSNKYLLRLHLGDGINTKWRAGELMDGGLIIYKLDKQEFGVTIDAGVVKRSLGVSWVDVKHGDTAAFNFRKVAVEEFKAVDDQGKEVIVKRIIDFLGWEDAAAVMVVLRTALMQPRKGLALGNIDFKKLLIVGGVIAIAIWVVIQVKNKGAVI